MREWNKLFNISGKYIYRNDGQPTEYNRICDETVTKSIASYIVKMSVITISFIVASIGPFYSYVHDGTLATLYSLKLPYFNQDPYTEFLINVVWQFLITLIGGIALFLMEGAVTLINDTITVSSTLCCRELEELSDQQATENEQRRKLKMIFMKIIYMDKYDFFSVVIPNMISKFFLQIHGS